MPSSDVLGVSIKQFGSVGKGKGDAAVFQKAVTETAAAGEALEIPAGTYILEAMGTGIYGQPYAVRLPSNTRIIGRGNPVLKQVGVVATNASTHYEMLQVIPGASDISVDGVWFQGTNDGTEPIDVFCQAAAFAWFGLNGPINVGAITPVSKIRVRNCRFFDLHGFSGHGQSQRDRDIRFEDCMFRRTANGLNPNGSDVHVIGCSFDDAEGIEIYGGSVHVHRCHFTNRSIVSLGGGAEWFGPTPPPGAEPLRGVFCTDNVFDNPISHPTGNVASLLVATGSNNVVVARNRFTFPVVGGHSIAIQVFWNAPNEFGSGLDGQAPDIVSIFDNHVRGGLYGIAAVNAKNLHVYRNDVDSFLAAIFRYVDGLRLEDNILKGVGGGGPGVAMEACTRVRPLQSQITTHNVITGGFQDPPPGGTANVYDP